VTKAGTGSPPKLADGSFDLVLFDIIMPEFDGFCALEFIKADQRLRYLPLIILTAMDEVESTVRCIEAGAEDFVPRPFNPIVLWARIKASLEKSTCAITNRPSSSNFRLSAPSPNVCCGTSCPAR
jgi:DNA-binding response OmpR family regulator